MEKEKGKVVTDMELEAEVDVDDELEGQVMVEKQNWR